MSASILIATRASLDKKERFRALASSRGLDESKLLTLLIDRVLERNAGPRWASIHSRADTPSERITIRLRPGDAELLAHAHLRGNPPLPLSELLEVKRAVAEVSALGRNLARIGRDAQDSKFPRALAEELVSVRTLLEKHRGTHPGESRELGVGRCLSACCACPRWDPPRSWTSSATAARVNMPRFT